MISSLSHCTILNVIVTYFPYFFIYLYYTNQGYIKNSQYATNEGSVILEVILKCIWNFLRFSKFFIQQMHAKQNSKELINVLIITKKKKLGDK